jgi:hypothetical protein
LSAANHVLVGHQEQRLPAGFHRAHRREIAADQRRPRSEQTLQFGHGVGAPVRFVRGVVERLGQQPGANARIGALKQHRDALEDLGRTRRKVAEQPALVDASDPHAQRPPA